MVRTCFLVSEAEREPSLARRVQRLLGPLEGVAAVTVEGVAIWVDHDPLLVSVEALRVRLDHIGLEVTVA